MRMNVKVLGIGPRKRGVGKISGEPYDFTEISVLLPAWRMFAGEVGCICTVDQGVLDGHDQFMVGSSYDMEVATVNFKPSILAIYGR